jgi:hypothetical protein
MNIYAQLLDKATVGSKVGLTYIEGKAVASTTINHGRFGIIKSIKSGVAFIELLKDTQPKASADAGSALGVTIDLPVTASGYLTVTVEDDN